MEYQEITSVTGKGGLFEIVGRRENGMILRNLSEEKSKFYSSRVHLFTPLENITIYTEEDSVTLKSVFKSMQDMDQDKIADPGSKSDDLKTFFTGILPDYDKERVYPSDIKKIIKWYHILSAQDGMSFEESEEDEAQNEGAEETQSSEQTKEQEA